MIRVENLKKSFGINQAVDGLSFEIQKGEIVGFLGPNGAGKTTTMRLITGFFQPDEGKIEVDNMQVDGKDINIQKHIGYLPENNPLYKDMLVSEILNLSAELKQIGKSKKRNAVDFVVKAVGIGDVYYKTIGELSKGFRQRVGMAIALLGEPPILIMDEPTEGLDPNQRTDIRLLIKKLARDRTIIMSTHVMQEAAAICNRLIIINNGKLIADGSSEELSNAASNERVLLLELEGEGVDLALRNLAGVEHVDLENLDNGHVSAKLITNNSIELRPEISTLARTHNWTIWKLGEKEQKLEDVFHKLTSEK